MNLTIEDLLEAQTFFRLPSPALVEKDFYVARALRAVAATDTGDLRLVFWRRDSSLSRPQAA